MRELTWRYLSFLRKKQESSERKEDRKKLRITILEIRQEERIAEEIVNSERFK